MFDDDDGRFKRRLDVVTSTEERQSLDLSQPNKRVGRGNKRNQMRKIQTDDRRNFEEEEAFKMSPEKLQVSSRINDIT